jgi:hypothetical protein
MQRGPSFVRVALTLVVAALAASVVLGGRAGAATMTTQSVVRSATAAIAGQRGVHVVFAANSGASSLREDIVADAGSMTGSESVSEGDATLTVRVTPSSGYVKGSRSGLTSLFGLSTKQASALGRQWESWKVGTSRYASLKADVTLTAVKALLPKPAGTRLSTRTVNGSKTYVLQWTTAATRSQPKLANSLTVWATSFLPARETTTASDGGKLTTTLSRWSERVQVSAPPVDSTQTSVSVGG